MGGSFPWRVSSSPWTGFGRCSGGPGEGPLDSGEGGVGGRRGDGLRGGGGDGDRFGILKRWWIGIGVIADRPCDSGFGVVAGDGFGSSFAGVEGRVLTNLHSYGDSISLGSVGSEVSSARNMCFRRSSLQYRSRGVDRRDSSSFFIRAAGSTRTAC